MCGSEVLPWLAGVKPAPPGHAPAVGDNRFPRMEVNRVGGKPNKGTKKDKRLKKNKK